MSSWLLKMPGCLVRRHVQALHGCASLWLLFLQAYCMLQLCRLRQATIMPSGSPAELASFRHCMQVEDELANISQQLPEAEAAMSTAELDLGMSSARRSKRARLESEQPYKVVLDFDSDSASKTEETATPSGMHWPLDSRILGALMLHLTLRAYACWSCLLLMSLHRQKHTHEAASC